MKCRVQIWITGIVQGVGFRPFIYNLANKYNLKGYVLNNTSGVNIEVEGESSIINEFIQRVKNEPPPQAVIFEFRSQTIEPVGYEDFTIRESDDREEKFVPISPEIATCKDCLQELFDPSNRRYRYPFINCTNCGPRFTIVKDIPYDRKFTTMAPFIMCARCHREYTDPTDRRFHAQPNACPECGPKLSLLDHTKKEIQAPDILSEVCRLLTEGRIVAIKGLGGYHLACDAMNNDAVVTLRSRKFREHKPFAIMVKDVEAAKSLCFVNESEEKLLKGTTRPIVLLKKRADCPVVESVAPYQEYHGVMLPYTPLHHLLMAESGLVLVMTSGNISSEPIVYQDDEAFDRLKGIPDYYLVNDRKIHIRTDDSVSRVWRGKEVLLRRARGYCPYPLILPFQFEKQILACGPELKNTFCLTRGHYAFVSHHIGDLENLEALTSFEQGIEHFKRIFNIDPVYVAYDLHPDYLSTKYALALNGIPKIGIQHHHAHIASCMCENNLEGKVMGVSFDGTGYGTDGKIWGGEFLICDYGDFERVAHLEYVLLPGGDKAINEPWRMAASYLFSIYGDNMFDLDIDFIRSLDKQQWLVIRQMIEKRINSPLTSSSGRLFDAVSALVGVRQKVYYEGQAAIELEMAADLAVKGAYDFDFKENTGGLQILTAPIFRGIISDIRGGSAISMIAGKFHNTIANIVLDVCSRGRQKTGIEKVALSGGVFQNSLLLTRTFDLLDKNGFKVYTQHRVPPNDGGVSLGQAVIANELIRRGKA